MLAESFLLQSPHEYALPCVRVPLIFHFLFPVMLIFWGDLPVTEVTQIQFVQQGALLLWQTRHFRTLLQGTGFLSPGHPSELAALEYSYPADYTAGMRREILHSLMSPINRSCGWDRENSANLAMSLIQLDTFLLTYSSKCSLDPVAAPRCFCPCTVTLMDVSLNASPTLSSLAGFAMIQHFLSFGKYPKSGPRVLRASHHVLISVIKL